MLPGPASSVALAVVFAVVVLRQSPMTSTLILNSLWDKVCLELLILLPPPSKCGDHSYVSSWPGLHSAWNGTQSSRHAGLMLYPPRSTSSFVYNSCHSLIHSSMLIQPVTHASTSLEEQSLAAAPSLSLMSVPLPVQNIIMWSCHLTATSSCLWCESLIPHAEVL